MDKFKYLSAVEIFLLSPDEKEVLLIHRGKDRKFLPDYYAGLGGKMDFSVNESPLNTALREIEEESGYKKKEIKRINLNAVFTAIDKYGKWLVFDFVGKVKNKNFTGKKETDEGVLEWVAFDNLKNLKLIPDLNYGVLEKILFTKELLWIKSDFDENDKIINLFVNDSKIL